MHLVPLVIWHGDLAEAYQLAAAIQNNCACATGHCGAHQAMLDQRFINGILFARSIRERLLREEFKCKSPRSETWRSLLDG